jgi:hypothetical protein
VWLGLLSLWAIFCVLGTWFNYQAMLVRNRPISWTQATRMNVAEYGIWATLLTPLVLLLCARFPLDRKSFVKVFVAHLLAITGVVCIDVAIKTLLGGTVFPGAQTYPFFPQYRRYLFSEAEADIQIYLLIAFIGYVVAYYSALRDQERHAAELETHLVRAELQVLKMQLQPHFLFNTLHSIASLVHTDPRAAKKMICSLGDLLRATLAAEDLPQVSLRRELDFLEMYLDIQRVRFQDRLLVELRVADDILDAKVPYMLLQPLVENAIKHGVARRSGLGRVEVEIRKEAEELLISVVNDSVAAGAVTEHDGLGIGLENIRSRLKILYDSRGRLSARELNDGRFRVEIEIPFETAISVQQELAPVQEQTVSGPVMEVEG